METVLETRNVGQAAFTKRALGFYDSLVLGLTCRLVWRCPNERVLAWYGEHLSANHLEVGVGTGYFLDHAVFPGHKPRLGLLDLNRNCLERTANRIARYRPEVFQANLLTPIDIPAPRFDSLAMNYVLHCLPGSFPEKGVAFANVKGLLNPGGKVFGATVLNGGVPRSLAARAFIRFFNARRTLGNAHDEYDGLLQALEQHLKDVRVEVVGCVALFSGRI